jgi:micrococcal nuclease
MRRSFKRAAVTAVVVAAAMVVALAVALARSGGAVWGRVFPGAAHYRVIDGDTIILEGVGSVRYIGLDAPERDERHYREARRYNAELLARGQIRLVYGPERYDRYGRTLAYVYVRDVTGRATFVNEEVLRAGWAETLEIPPNVAFASLFRRAEEEARREGRGIWAAGAEK